MPFDIISPTEALTREGLRLVMVSGVPSPWGEAAKGFLQVKGLDFVGVRLSYDDTDLHKLTGGRTDAPVLVYDAERPRHTWSEILLLAERLSPAPALLPADALDRALVIGLCHEILGEDGLAWARRVRMIHLGLRGEGGFPAPAAAHLAPRYGYREAEGEALDAHAAGRIEALITMLSDRLTAQEAAGSPFLIGQAMSAADIVCAAAMAIFGPLPREVCDMREPVRAAMETPEGAVDSARLDRLFAHRDMMYKEHLPTPLTL